MRVVANQAKKSADSVDAQIGKAWGYHSKNQNEEALAEFRALVDKNPSHIDAQYGLALTLAALGKKEEALNVYGKVAELVQAEISRQSAEDEDARYRMLARMIKQRVEGLTAGNSA